MLGLPFFQPPFLSASFSLCLYYNDLLDTASSPFASPSVSFPLMTFRCLGLPLLQPPLQMPPILGSHLSQHPLSQLSSISLQITLHSTPEPRLSKPPILSASNFLGLHSLYLLIFASHFSYLYLGLHYLGLQQLASYSIDLKLTQRPCMGPALLNLPLCLQLPGPPRRWFCALWASHSSCNSIARLRGLPLSVSHSLSHHSLGLYSPSPSLAGPLLCWRQCCET